MTLTRRSLLGFLITIAMPFLVIAAEQAGDTKTVTASVSVTPSNTGRSLAVLSKGTGGEAAFLFCIDLQAPQKIEFNGPARVVYRPLPVGDIPAGVKIQGPEDVSSVLAVLPASGKGWLFVGKNEKATLSGDPAVAAATVIPVRVVRRVDWIGDNRERRGMDIESCFEVGG